MTEYYQGPNNRAELLAVTITLPTIAVFLTVWRIWYRAARKLLGMTDLFLVAGLVSLLTTTRILPGTLECGKKAVFVLFSELTATTRLSPSVKRDSISQVIPYPTPDYCPIKQTGMGRARQLLTNTSHTAYTSWGYGYHKDDIPPEVLSNLIPKKVTCINLPSLSVVGANIQLVAAQLFWVNQIFFKTAAGSIKLSICAVYLGVFRRPVLTGARIAQIANYVLIGVVGGYYFGGTLVSTFQCDPIHKAWMPDVEGKCIKNDQFRLANGYINCITSLWIIILPFPVLLGMERKNKELLQFLGLVALGLM